MCLNMGCFKKISVILCIFYYVTSVIANRLVVSIDERWICNIKQSCQDCLHLPHCTWCPTENRCFSENLPHNEQYCVEKRIRHLPHRLSLEENAACACAGPEVENSCPPGDVEQKCSGRGKCICGRCFCDTNSDPMHPSKVITGEHCEYDNFSCDGPKCNEGPYYIYQESELNIGEETEKS